MTDAAPPGTADPLVEVHLLRLPVPLWSKSKQISDELLREFALAAAAEEDGEHHLPARLTQLIERVTATFAGVSTSQEQELFAAEARGQEEIADLVFHVPAAAGAASQQIADMLDEADEYCRQGRHLLTLAAPDDVVAFRRWYLGAFVDQVAGAPPVPWPDYDRSRSA